MSARSIARPSLTELDNTHQMAQVGQLAELDATPQSAAFPTSPKVGKRVETSTKISGGPSSRNAAVHLGYRQFAGSSKPRM